MVQGVGFRYFTLDVACTLGLNGFVRNLPDGRVEVWAEGVPRAIEQLRAQLSRGPAGSQVSEITDETAEATGEHPGFRIL